MRRLAVFALLAGCTGGIDFNHFAGALSDARCAYYVRCGTAANAAECRAYFDGMAIDNSSTQSAIDSGKIIYHEDIAQDCLDAYAALSCDSTQQTSQDLDVCNGVLTGTLATGGICAFDKECESQNCVVPTCPMACCTGACDDQAPLPTIGQPCTAFCAGDAFCGVDSICHPYLTEGSPCTIEPCATGLYCAGRTMTMAGTCKALPHIGQPCEGACAEIGATCYLGTCTAVGILDDPCTVDAQCSQFYDCTNNQCALLPTLGMACTTTCYEAAYCDGTSCVAQKAVGTACVRNDECTTHYCSSSKCAEVPLCF
ncbi:MAG TPA: hypothetical protein VIV40_20185 [Kofleriaceae bacterium]